VDDALPLIELVRNSSPKNFAFSASTRSARFLRVGLGLLRSVVGVVVDDAERFLGRAHLTAGEAQPLERLRARHLVHQVAVDIEEASAVGLLVDQVVVPDLVVEGAGLGHWVSRLSEVAVYLEARAAQEKCPAKCRCAGRFCVPGEAPASIQP
jgi:hypothetical protein